MSIQAVIFDVAGVLLRTEDTSGQRLWEQKLGLQEGELFKIVMGSDVSRLSMVGRATQAEIWQSVAKMFNLDAVQIGELAHEFWAGDRLDPVLIRFLGELRPNYKIGILSDAWLGLREMWPEMRQLDELADVVVLSAEEGIAKPDPRIFHITLDRLGVEPHQAVLVDDRPGNVKGASDLGLHAVYFETTGQAMRDVRELLDNAR